MRPRIGITSAPVVQDGRPNDRVNGWYSDAVSRAGGLPLILPTLDRDRAPEMAALLDGLVLTGGGDVDPARYHQRPVAEVYDVNPARDAWEWALLDEAGRLDQPLPVLGICRGAQLLNVSRGGSLIQHLAPGMVDHRQRPRDREEVHDVEVAPGSRLAEILGRTRLGVNSIHHQAIDHLGAGLVAVAWAPDGTVEAVEADDGSPVVAVQWHPEGLTHLAPHEQLFLWLTRSAARRCGLDLPAAFQPAALIDEVA